jgi:hypothetical protein
MAANNAAGRLNDILVVGRTKAPQLTARQAWAQIFDLNPKNTAALLNAVAEVIHLVRDAKAKVRSVDATNKQLYLKVFGPIEKAFAQANLEMKWSQFLNHLDQGTMARLEMVADILGREIPDPVAEVGDLSDLLDRTNALIDAAIAASIPQQLKTAILESLESIRNSIRSYRMRGFDGLVDTLVRTANSVAANESVFSAYRDDDVVKRFFEVVGILNQIVAGASNVGTYVLPSVQRLLTPGS